jgi:hypothetical protein
VEGEAGGEGEEMTELRMSNEDWLERITDERDALGSAGGGSR